jgi:RNA polymerase sigma-70 factor (ECF subfamily)
MRPTQVIVRPVKREVSLRFDDFFADEYPRLGRALYLLTGNREEAEDLAQESMARAYERWDRIQRMASPAGYVYRVATNLHRRRWRRNLLLSSLTATERRPASSDGSSAEAGRVLEILENLSVE